MHLSHGRKTVAIPGPSMFPDRVLNAMHRAAPNIYSDEIAAMTASIKADLADVARTTGDALIYIGNGHAAWEAALSNTINRGDKFLAISTGRFTKGWIEVAQMLGADVEEIDFGTQSPLDANKIEERLRADTSHEIKGVMTVHTDTASSVRNDIPALRAAMDAAQHPALLLVDCIASLGCEPFEMDAWGVDVMVAGCQKGLMVPPGVSFNFVNEKASKHRDRVTTATGYWDWRMRQNPEIFYMNFFGTAPTHHLFGLECALEMLLREEGLEAAWARHDIHARAVWAALEAWASAGALRMNITDPAQRSTAVTTIICEQAETLRSWTESRCGLTLGVGLGLDNIKESGRDSIFRIGHMGHLNPPMILGTLGTLEAGLKALNIPHGDGAIPAAAQIIAENA